MELGADSGRTAECSGRQPGAGRHFGRMWVLAAVLRRRVEHVGERSAEPTHCVVHRAESFQSQTYEYRDTLTGNFEYWHQ